MTRRGLRWLRRSALALVALLAVGVVTAWVALRTEWGREYIRAAVVDGVSGAVEGFGIGAIDRITLSGQLTARDVVLGGDAIVVPEVRVDCDLLGLLRSRLECESVEVVEPAVFVDVDGDRVNLEDMVIADSDADAKPFSIDLPNVRIRGGTTRVRVDREVDLLFEHDEIDAHVIMGETRRVLVRKVVARWPETEVEVEGRQGSIDIHRDSRGTVLIGDVDARWGGATVRTRSIRYQVNRWQVGGELAVDAPAEAARAAVADLLGEPELAADIRSGVRFDGRVDKDGPGIPFSARGALAAGGGDMDLTLERIDLAPFVAKGRAVVRDVGAHELFDLSRAVRASGTVDFDVLVGPAKNDDTDGDTNSDDDGSVRVDLVADVAGSVEGFAVDRVVGKASLRGRAVAGQAEVTTGRGGGTIEAAQHRGSGGRQAGHRLEHGIGDRHAERVGQIQRRGAERPQNGPE